MQGTQPQPQEVGYLIGRCVDGDDSAKAEFLNAYDWLVRAAVKRELAKYKGLVDVPLEADDICHDVFLKLFNDACRLLRGIRKPRSINAWLMTVSQNHVHTLMRSRITEDRHRDEMRHSSTGRVAPAPSSELSSQEQAGRLRAHLAKLEPEERLAVELFYVHELRYSEIATVLNMNMNTLASKLHRAKAKLRSLVEEEGE